MKMLADKQLNFDHEVYKLSVSDFAAWKELRHEALALCPDALSSTCEEHSKLSVADFKMLLTHTDIFGVLHKDKLVGTAGVAMLQLQKFRHRGSLLGMYLKEEYRGSGMADNLLKTIIQHAKQTLVLLTCGVMVQNSNALRFYQRHGFKIIGTVPRSMKFNGIYYDEYSMYLELDQ